MSTIPANPPADSATPPSPAVPPSTPGTQASLAADLRRLGLTAGDAVFVHASYKSLGPVDGGAATVVAALEQVIGATGTLLMPSFNLIVGGYDARLAAWNHHTTPATTGWLCEYFRQMPGTVRSNHYSHSVAVRGRDAADFVGGHHRLEGLPSVWDRDGYGLTYGTHSPMMQLLRHPRARVLLLGADHHSSTYCHVAEVLFWEWERRRNPGAPYTMVNRDAAGRWYDATGPVRRGVVGAGRADSRLFPVSDYVNAILALMQSHPEAWCPWYRPRPAPATATVRAPTP